MSELERVEKLCGNLTHAIVDVRVRSAQNLQFKLLSNVLGDGIYASSSMMRSLADGITSSLQTLLSGGEWQSPATPACKLMEELLQLTHTIGLKASRSAPEATNESFAALLDKLYTIFGKCTSSDPMHKLAQQAIESICTIKIPSADAGSQLVSTRGDYNPVPAHMLHSPITTPGVQSWSPIGDSSSGDKQQQSQQQHKLHRGAGAILQSALVYSGWKFSKVVLTDSDERYLFDLEVKLKLGHDTSVQLLWDCLSDFPAPVLVTRPGLMVAVLDLVGAVYTQDQLSSSPGGLNPLTAMAWLEALLDKSVDAFVMQMEGSLCSSVPASSQPTKPVDDVGSPEHGKPTLAAQMARAMYTLRYPLLPLPDSEAEAASELRKSAASAPLNVSPAPSLPGLAFAACAASMPLLQGRDPQIASQVLKLLKTALPLIREPAIAAADGNDISEELPLTDRKRIQHLLNRSEQLIRFFADSSKEGEASALSVDRILALCVPLNHQESPKAAAGGEESDPVARVEQAAFQAALLQSIVEVLMSVPEGLVRPVPAIASDAEKANTSLLEVGTMTLGLVKDLIASAGGSSSLLEVGEGSVVENQLIAILRQADPAAADGIDYASELLQSISSLQQMAELGDSPPRDTPAKFLLNKLLEKAHVVVNLLDCGHGSEALRDQVAEVGSAIPEIAVVLLAASVSCSTEAGIEPVLRDPAVASAVSLVLRLSCCCGALIRAETFSCLLGVLTAGQTRELSQAQVDLLKTLKFKAFPLHQLLSALATPSFCHCVLLFGLLGADAADLAYAMDNTVLVVSGSSPPLNDAMIILEHLLSFMLTSSGLDVAAAGAWAPLLAPLKACEWELSADLSLQVPHAITAFLALLEDCCAASAPTSKARVAYGLALSLGLFHSNASVRARCAVRLRHELVGLKAGSYEFEGGAALDPFVDAETGTGSSNSNVPNLVSWGYLQTATATTPPELKPVSVAAHKIPSRLSNHSECRKLASISFSSSHELSIRSTALRQLWQMLSDRHIMATSEGGWCVAVAASCSQLLMSVSWSSADQGPETRRPALVEARMVLEAATLLRLLVFESEAVRAAAVFTPSTDKQDEQGGAGLSSTLDVSLWPLLTVVLRGPASPTPAASATFSDREVDSSLLEAQLLCSQALAALVHDSRRWADALSAPPPSVVQAHSGFQAFLSDVPAASSGGSGGSLAHAESSRLNVPVFLSAAFNYVLSAEHVSKSHSLLAELGEDVRADVWPFQITVMRCEIGDRSSAGRSRPLPTRHTMTLVARAAFSPAPFVLLSTASAALCSAIATAGSHKALRSIVHSVSALGRALPGLFGALVVEDLRLSMHRLLTVPPRSRNDTVTLAAALKMLSEVVAACVEIHRAAVGLGQDSAWEVTQAASVLLEDVASAVLAPLSSVLTDFKEASAGAAQSALSPSFTSRDHVAKDGATEATFARQEAQRSMLDLLSALCAVPYPLLSLRGALVDQRHSLPHVLVQMAGSELVPSWKRAKAATILESLLTLHDVRPALIRPLSEIDGLGEDGMAVGPGKDGTSLDVLLKAVKLLRTPDSLRGNGCVIASLRVFYLCIKQFSCDEAPCEEEGRWWKRVRDWGWVTRLGWDRRGEVRMLTLSILQALLPVLPEVQGKSLAITVDSLESGARAGVASGAASIGSGEWPPVDSLLHVLLDCSEAHGVRALALQCVLSCLPTVAAGGNTSLSSEVLVSAAMDLIGSPTTQFSRMQASSSYAASSASAALTALMTLVTELPAADVAAMASNSSMKVLPAIMGLVRNDLRTDLQQAALFRVGLVPSPDDATPGAGSVLAAAGGVGARRGGLHGLTAHPGSLRFVSKPFSMSSAGWERRWHQFVCSKLEVGASLVQAGACRVLQALAPVISSVPASALPPLGKDSILAAARQTSLLRGLFSLLCGTEFLLQTPARSSMAVAADRRGAAAADLVVSLLNLTSTSSNSGGKDRDRDREHEAGSRDSGAALLSALLQSEPFVVGLMLRRLTIRLEKALLDGPESLLPEQTMSFASSSLRLLCLLLDVPVFVALLSELDWPERDFDGSQLRASPVREFTLALMRLRVALLELDPPPLQFAARLDVAIGFWCQRFPSAKAVLFSEGLMAAQGEGTCPLLDHYIETLGLTANELAQGPGGGAGGAGSPSSNGTAAWRLQQQQQADMRRSLTALKKKTGAGSGYGSTSGPVIVKPSENLKWRKQARGYTFSPPASPSDRSSSLTPPSRLTTWASLIALTGCLPHAAGTRRALTLGLAPTLATLAKLTQAWGVSVSTAGGASADHNCSRKGGGGGGAWSPTNAELSSAVLSACCSLAHSSNDAKLALASAGEAAASVRGAAAAAAANDSSSGVSLGMGNGRSEGSSTSNLLHQLVNAGVYSSVQTSSRLLSLALCASLLRAPNSSPTLQKAALAHVLSVGLQRSLSGRTPPLSSSSSSSTKDGRVGADTVEATPFLLHALAACMLSEAVSGAASGGAASAARGSVGRDITNMVSQLRDAKNPDGALGDADYKPVSVPQLLGWVAESHADRPDIIAAAIRALASLAAAATEGTPAAKRLFAIAGSLEPMKLLVSAAVSQHDSLAALAHIALWIVVHSSSAALANAKALVAPLALADFVLTRKGHYSVFSEFSEKASANILVICEDNRV